MLPNGRTCQHNHFPTEEFAGRFSGPDRTAKANSRLRRMSPGITILGAGQAFRGNDRADDAVNAAVPSRQAAASDGTAPVSAGRFLRAFLRRRGGRIAPAR